MPVPPPVMRIVLPVVFMGCSFVVVGVVKDCGGEAERPAQARTAAPASAEGRAAAARLATPVFTDSRRVSGP